MKNADKNFRNFIEYPINTAGKSRRNACGFISATGDEAAPVADTSVKAAVSNITMWSYAKTGLALLGAYVAIKFIYGKIK